MDQIRQDAHSCSYSGLLVLHWSMVFPLQEHNSLRRSNQFLSPQNDFQGSDYAESDILHHKSSYKSFCITTAMLRRKCHIINYFLQQFRFSDFFIHTWKKLASCLLVHSFQSKKTRLHNFQCLWVDFQVTLYTSRFSAFFSKVTTFQWSNLTEVNFVRNGTYLNHCILVDSSTVIY